MKRLISRGEYWGYHLPVRIRPEHTETYFVTDLALDYLAHSAQEPFFLHLSYVKPHPGWGLSESYSGLYDYRDMPEAVRTRGELEKTPDFFLRFRKERGGELFDNDLYRRQVWACYLGLVTELNDMIGRILACLRSTALKDRTLVLLSSDHGCFLGDHWMHQTEYFYDSQVRIPPVIYHPRFPGSGRLIEELVEGVDFLPTFLEAAGASIPVAIQGRSLMPFLCAASDVSQTPTNWRKAAHAEWDFRYYKSRLEAGLAIDQSQGIMLRNEKHKYVYFTGLPSQLFDMENDPGESTNLAGLPEYRALEDCFRAQLLRWRMASDDPVPLLSSEFKLPGSVDC